MALDIKAIGAGNLPDAARLCLAGRTLSDRPPAFTREVELESTRCKLSYLRTATMKGSKALAAYRSGMLVGYVEAHPIEEALVPVDGKGCHVIGCLRVPEESERAEVEPVLIDALVKAVPQSKGLAVLARDKDWKPLGFTEAFREPSEVESIDRVLWWKAVTGGDAPKTVAVDRKIPKIEGKVRVDLFTNHRCPWDQYVFDLVRRVCTSMKDATVVVYETDCSRRREVLRSGVAAAIAVQGRYQPWVRPNRLPDDHTVRRTIEAAI